MKPLEGQTALITGAVRRIGRATALELSQLGAAVVINSRSSRDEAEAAIKDRGGKSPGSVSAKTYCVVVGEDPGASKVTKATELGIPMIQADAFQKLLDTGSI